MKYTSKSLFNRKIVLLIFILSVSQQFFCQRLELNNQCDPKSNQFNSLMLKKNINGEKGMSCWSPFLTILSDTNDLLTFSFKDSLNDLSKSYEGKIEGSTITVNLPYGIVASAIPSFTTNARTVSTSNAVLVSEVSAVDFSSTLNLRTTSASGISKTYTIIVNPIHPIADTGQTTCWDAAGNPQTCSGSGNDGQFIDLPNSRSFSGPFSLTDYPNDYVTRNKVTGLLWKTCTEGKTGPTCSGGTATTQFWTASTNLCSALNSANNGSGFAGKKNWRLPTILELASLNNYQNTSPTLDTSYFPQSVGSGYWSSTANKTTAGNYQYVNFLNSTIGDFPDATAGNARCVSGNLPPNQSFTDNGDGTVLDNRTNLLWQKCSDGLSGNGCTSGTTNSPLWAAASTTCLGVTTNGKSWRLPNAIELHSIFDDTQSSGPFINSVFPNTTSTQYWTSTTYAAGTTSGILVYFNTGSVSNLTKANARPLRCVTN